MKNIFVVFVFLFTYNSYSQYIPMLEEDNVWHIAYWSFWNGGWTHSKEITLFGEEEINGKIYKKVYRDGELTNCRLREENGIVYSYEQNINNEKVILDFNMQIGDVLPEDYYCLGGGGGNVVDIEVVDIYTQNIAGEERKVLEFEGTDIFGDLDYSERWIEGIGSTAGIVPFGYNYDFFDDLACFTKNGETTYFNGHTQCVITLNTDDIINNKIIFYPNPVTNRSILQFTNISVDHIKLLDVTGKLIKEELITNGYYMIDAIQYPSGMYFYQVYNDGKLIKTDQFIVK